MSRHEEDQEEEVIDFEFSTGTTEDGVGLKYVNWVATGLKPVPDEGRRPTNVPENSPFVDARVRTATNDYVGEAIPDSAHYDTQVPIWVSADLRQTISTAECGEIRSRNQSKLVCEIIRRRGYADGVDLGMYNTGQLVAISLMGGYVDFNLFPQKRHLNNRGNRLEEISTWHYWCGIESLIRRYLRTERRNPRVEFQARLWYDNPMMPDLPSRISYSVRFLRISGEEDEETKEVVQTIRTLLSSAVTVANYNDARDFDNNARERISENQSTPASTSRASGSDAGGATAPQSQDRNRDTLSYLLWHSVPVVGTYRILKEGFEDIADGNAASGGGKLVVGIVIAGLEYQILMTLADEATRSIRLMREPWGEPLKELRHFAKKAGESFLCACYMHFAKLMYIYEI